MSGLGDALSQAAGLGLAGAKALGGAAARGLGMAPPPPAGMFGAPEQSAPADLSDLSFQQNPLGNVLMRVQNAIASSQGQPSASGQLRAQRQAGNQQRIAAFNEGLQLVGQMNGILDKTAPADVEKVNGQLRQRFAELAGGKPGDAERFYDAFMGGRAGHTQALLDIVKNDAAIQEGIASGWGIGEIEKAASEKIHKGIVFADQENLPKVRAKIEAIFNSTDPAVREQIEKAYPKEGPRRFTLSNLRDLNQTLPPELQMTNSEWETARRHESDIGGMSGMQTPEEVMKEREQGITSAHKQADDAARIKAEMDAKLKEIEKTAELRPPPKPASEGTQQNLGYKIRTKRALFRQSEADVDQALNAPLNGIGDVVRLYGLIHTQDNTAVREGELALAQSAAGLADRLQRLIGNKKSGDLLGPEERSQIMDYMRQYKAKIHGLHVAFVKDEAASADSFSPGSSDKMIPGWREFVKGAAEPGAGGPSPDTAGAGKPKTITQNGHTYTYNDQTGQYE